MKRRTALQVLGSILTACAIPSHAEQPSKIPVVGVPLIAAGPNDNIMVMLRRGLGERGFDTKDLKEAKALLDELR